MRSVRGEAVSLLLALSLPAAAFCLLPYSLPKGEDAPGARSDGFAAFVSLSPEEEAQATRRAKPSARTAGTASASMRAMDLILGKLPDDAPAPLLAEPPAARPPRLPGVAAAPRLLPRRPPPARLTGCFDFDVVAALSERIVV